MKTSTSFLAVVLLLLPSPPARPEEDSPAAAARGLAPDLASGDRGKAEAAHRKLEQLSFAAGRPGAEAERKALALALAEEASREDLAVDARARLLQALELTGKGEAVPALAKLLGGASPAPVREGARRALEANPHVNAKRALREALAGAPPELRIGIIGSLGVRKDPLATGPLIEAAADPNPEVKIAAIDALSKIGDISAVPVLEAALKEIAGPGRAAAERAYLRLADSLARMKERGAARRIYDRALGMGRSARCAALIGIGQAGLQNATPKVVEALGDPDPQVRGAAREAAAIMPGDEMTKALGMLLDEAEEEGDAARRSELLDVLSRRSDAASRERVLAAAEKGADDAYRIRALDLLAAAARAGALDAASSHRALGAAVASLRGARELREAAEELLIALPGEEAGQVMVGLVAEGSPETRAAILGALAARGDRRGLAAAHAAARDPDPAVKGAALEAIGRLGDSSDALTLVEALRGDAPGRPAAERALGRLKGEEVEGLLIQAAKEEGGSARASVIRALGSRGTDASARVIEAAARDSDPEVRIAALEALGRRAGAAGIPLALAAMESAVEAERDAAVGASIRIADALPRERSDEAAKVYVKALAAGKRAEDLRSALEGIGETAGPEALDALGSFLSGAGREALGQDAVQALRREAGRAALRIAEKLPGGSEERAREIYRRILESRPDRATARQAARRLRRLGVDVDIGGQDGFVTRWWVLGPIPDPEGVLWDKRLGPEGGVDPGAPAEIEGASYRWRSHDAPDGILSLQEAGYTAERCIAYLHAEIAVPPGDALFKIGSDDHVACFLNGEKVHEHKGDRGLTADEDTARVKLREGKNTVLLKVGNQGGDWGACLRLVDLDGKPIPPRQGIPEAAAPR